MDDGSDDYNIILFAITESFPEGLPPMKDITAFVEKHGIRIPGHVSFPPGYVVDFFQIIKDRIGVDLLPIIGGTCYENPEEEYLAAGALALPDVEKAAIELKSLLVSKEGMIAYESAAAKKKLDGAWALQALKDFLRLLLKGCDSSPKPQLIIGMFE